MFKVYENNKPADDSGFPNMDESWDPKDNFHRTFDEAVQYMEDWLDFLGESSSEIPDMRINIPVYFNDSDFIEIRQI